MKIGIDISQIAHRGTGVAQYTSQLIDVLTSTDHELVFFYSSLRLPLDKDVRTKLSERGQLKEFSVPPTLLNILWNKMHILPIEMFIGPVDIFISSDWTQPPLRKALGITIVHDLIVYTYPKTVHPKIISTMTKRLQRVQKTVETIVTDSESTKRDMEKYLNISKDRVKVIYPPVQKGKRTKLSELKKTYGITQPYVLSVGKIEPRKNIKRLMSAFIKAKLNDVELIIVGPQGWGTLEIPKTNSIKFLGYVPENDLHGLYKNAEFFVYPSLYEGFGYPVVEAMLEGCPVVASKSSSIGEITENAGITFNPKSTKTLKEILIKLHNNEELRKQLSAAGQKHVKNFNMDTFTSSWINVLKETYENRN